jgi:hypothetical protein
MYRLLINLAFIYSLSVLPSSDSKKKIPQESKNTESSPKAIRNVNSGNGTTTDNALNTVETPTIS